jgi:glycine oxidase
MSRAVRVDAAIAGGGIIGLSLGLELLRRGLTVAVMERGQAMGGASRAAAGMLAVHDPQNPDQLLPLALCSNKLYPEYLARVQELSRRSVPLRTQKTLQFVAWNSGAAAHATEAEIAELAPGLQGLPIDGLTFAWLNEASLDPRDLCEALPLAFVAAGGVLLENTETLGVQSIIGGVTVRTAEVPIAAAMFVNCCGAWAGESELGPIPVRPVKGQMLNLRCAPERLRCAVRGPGIYLVPRGDGRVAVGATIEDAGFDENVEGNAIDMLAKAALRLLPEASVPRPMDAWAGLRPGTPDGLPILGLAAQQRCWHATGHYRDGILLAPATARVMAQAMLGERTDVPLEPFSPERFLRSTAGVGSFERAAARQSSF